jgi:hypothetical protein
MNTSNILKVDYKQNTVMNEWKQRKLYAGEEEEGL